jgi:aminocarboxymuconate-semialdehyde decarboxylase
MRSGRYHRRQVLGGLAAGAAGLAFGSHRPIANAGSFSGNEDASGFDLQLIDFHSHFVGPAFTSIAGAAAPPALRDHFREVNRKLSSSASLLNSIEEAGITARVVNTPLEFIRSSGAEAEISMVQRINDQLADLVSRHPGRLYGMATVDAYSGDDGAKELTRAVRELGLRGVFLESAKGDLLLDAPEARPTLAAASALGVPIFVHPVNDHQLRQRVGRYGRPGMMLSRGTINAFALIALLERGIFDELPGLRVVVTTLAVGAVLLTGAFGDGRRIRQDTPELARRHVYIDTMGLNPVLIRSMVDLLGADHVLAGTDWPIFTETAIADRLQHALTACGLNAAEQRLVASGNALRLLGVEK